MKACSRNKRTASDGSLRAMEAEPRANGYIAQELASMIGWVSYDNLPKGQLFLAGSGWQLGFSGKQSNDVQSARERHNETWAGPRSSREGDQVGLEQPGRRILHQGQERTGPP